MTFDAMLLASSADKASFETIGIATIISALVWLCIYFSD